VNDSDTEAIVPEDTLSSIETPPALKTAPDVIETTLPTEPLRAGNAIIAAVRELVQTVLLALILFFLIRSVVQNFRIDGISMEPNFHHGQFLIVNRFAYCPGLHFELPPLSIKLNKAWCVSQPRRGDVIVFEYPLDTSRDFIKRVIALPGETVEVRNGQVLVDGKQVPEPFGPNPTARNFGPQRVPPDTVFVMGDNRNNSSDSRAWGPLPQKEIIGKAILSYWPPQLWAIVPQYDLTNLSAAN
jgi:signal peptidase I